jgi:hypothetical protein
MRSGTPPHLHRRLGRWLIMGNDEVALVRLWREKRGEVGPEDLFRSWYERTTGQRVGNAQHQVRRSAMPWMAATLDGIVAGKEAVFEAKFMLP